MSKFIKQMEMEDMRRTFGNVRDMVLLSVEKLDAQGEYTFRSNMRKKNIRLKVVKNTLARKVFKELDFQVPDDSPYWLRPTMLAWGAGSIKELSKELDIELRRSKNAPLYREKVKTKGAIADGQPVTFETAITLPTRQDLIAEIIGMILGPASSIAGCLVGPASQVASQIEKISEKKEDEAPAASTAPVS
jgi:large subunit ribosomal protein L10